MNDSIRFICEALGLKPHLEYSGGNKGWVGDNPFIFLDTKKIRTTGWNTTLTIRQGIERTLGWLQKNHWVQNRARDHATGQLPNIWNFVRSRFMNIVVLGSGIWHRHRPCCAKHFHVVGCDFDSARMADLMLAKRPSLSRGVNDLLSSGLASKQLSFTSDPASACANADVLWLCHDTPVNENDESDVDSVMADLRRALPHLRTGSLVLIPAQLPVETCRSSKRNSLNLHFA